MVCQWKIYWVLCCWVWIWMGVGVQGWGGGGSGRVVLIDNGRVNQSKAADALIQVKTTKFGTNVGLNMLVNISSRYFGGLFWSRQLRGLPSSDGYFFYFKFHSNIMIWCLGFFVIFIGFHVSAVHWKLCRTRSTCIKTACVWLSCWMVHFQNAP